MRARAAQTAAAVQRRRMQFRYGAVFLIILVLVTFEITAPSSDLARAVVVLLAAAALTVSVATSRAGGGVRRRRALAVSGAGAIVVIGIAAGVIGVRITFLVVTVLVALVPVTLAGGLLRLTREDGVSLQVVAGALAIYLLVGLLFASVITFVAHVESGQFFMQRSVTTGDEVYYSFTVLTTTGFGDFTAATPFGHALAVLEMLTGQLYLVTVIGVIVGGFVARRQ